ncbi:MAG: RHS repeat-associated core domain-containing protein [Candidatus Methanomethyliaceae archaeon]
MSNAAHKHAVTHVGGAQKYWYDAAGNATRRITTGQDITLSYDHENRLTGISGGATATYVYDGDGKLVKKTIAGTTTTLIGNYYELAGGTAKKHYYAGDVRIAVREGDTLYWLLTDHLGSTAVTTWSGGSRSAEVRYMPFGLERYEYGSQKTDYRFTGQRIEDSLDLYFYNARWYDPVIGRFIQPDTIVPNPGNPQNLNRYSYVLNNPPRYTDPTGHAECIDEECAWIVHPVSGRIMQRKPATSPLPLTGYDPAESVQQAWGLVYEWFSEQGPSVRYFGPESSLTQDIAYDPGIERFREAWAEAEYPLPWEWEHQADEREGGLLSIRMAKGGLVYARENLELGFATVGLGSENPEGSIDAVGGIIGSLDKISVKSAGGRLVKIEVINRMDWQSGTRIPGTNSSLIPWRLPRSAWGPGGAIVQHFYWWELVPTR